MQCNLAVIKGDGIGPEVVTRGYEGSRYSR